MNDDLSCSQSKLASVFYDLDTDWQYTKRTKVTDIEDDICTDNTIINGLGTIVLEVKRIEENGMDLRSQNNRSGQRFEPSITDNTFHESKLKLLSNCVGLGEAVFQPARPFSQRNPVPKWDVIEEDRGRLWLRFVFHYRAGCQYFLTKAISC